MYKSYRLFVTYTNNQKRVYYFPTYKDAYHHMKMEGDHVLDFEIKEIK